ncbi:MAG: hypothetical protein SNH05_06295, partial [Rikenellaceae bacterium]
VVNSANTSTPAYVQNGIYYQETPVNFNLYIGTKDENGDFVVDENGDYVEADGSTIYFSDNSDVVALFTDGTDIYGYGTGAATCTILESGKTILYDLTADVDYGLAESNATVTVYFPEVPTYGATASISFAAGAFMDVYGNVSNAVSTGDIYYRSRSLSNDDVVGSYSLYGYSGYYGQWIEETITITSSTGRNGGLYVNGLFDIYGEDIASSIPVTLNEHSGDLSIADWQLISSDWELSGDYYFLDGTYSVYFANYSSYDDIVFTFDGDSYSSDMYWGYYLDGVDDYGFYDVYTYSEIWENATISSLLSAKTLPSYTGELLERKKIAKVIR